MAWAIYEDYPETGDEIHLVTLLPSRSHDVFLQCELLVESVQKQPEYVCLSLTWGTQHLDSEIYLARTRTPIPVTASCYRALRALRAAKVHVVFIDQLSIDQSNIQGDSDLSSKDHIVDLLGISYNPLSSVQANETQQIETRKSS